MQVHDRGLFHRSMHSWLVVAGLPIAVGGYFFLWGVGSLMCLCSSPSATGFGPVDIVERVFAAVSNVVGI